MPYLTNTTNEIEGNGTMTVVNPAVIKGRVPNNCHLFLEISGTEQGTATVTTKFANGTLFIKPLSDNSFDLTTDDLSLTIINPVEEIKIVVTGSATDTVIRVVANWYE